MRFTLYAVAILLGACADRPALGSEPRLSVRVADVSTDTPSGRAELRQRDRAAAQSTSPRPSALFCRTV